MDDIDGRIDGIVARMRVRFKAIRSQAAAVGAGELMSELESTVQEAITEAANAFMQEVVQEQAVQRDVEEVRCACGGRVNVKDYRGKRVYTRHGSITLHRRYMICKKCGAPHLPLDKALRVPGHFSPAVVELMALMGVTDSGRRAEKKLLKLTGLHISHTTIIAHTVALGKDLQQKQVTVEPAQPLPCETLRAYASMDGVMINTQSGWREMKLGCLYDDGHLWRQYVASFEDCNAFGARLRKVAGLSGISKAKELIAIADGASWIWEQIRTRLPVAVEIVDFYHAAEHLATAARTLYGEGTPQAQRWLHDHRHILRHEGVKPLLKKLCNSRRYRKGNAELRRLVGYFKRHRSRMDYPRFKQQGYEIGSGLIESSCKNVAQARLKGPGMKWREENACAVATLRSALLSEHWDDFFVTALAG